MDAQHQNRLKRYLQKVAPGSQIEAMGARVAAAVPTELAAAPLGDEAQVAQTALQKMSADQPLSPREAFTIEAIILPNERPVIDIVNDNFTAPSGLWTHYGSDAAIRANIVAAIPSIGRIELPNHPTLPYGGTGFVVGDGLLMTNRHVAEIFTLGLGLKNLKFRPGLSAGIDFKRERGAGGAHMLRIKRVKMIHPFWDMALLEVEGLPPEHKSLKLSLANPDDLAGREVAVIGYPAFDPRNDAEVQNRVFRSVYNVKRLQPGKLASRERIDSFGNEVNAVTHDSSTLGGNSGSAIVDVTTGHVFGLHFAGVYLKANYGVPAFEIARDGRVVDAGVTFEARPQGGVPPWVHAWDEADPEGESTDETRPAGAQPAPAAGLTQTWSIPLLVNISIGTPTPVTLAAAAVKAAGAPVIAATEAAKIPFHDPEYADRTGYDADFLGQKVPMPTVLDENIVARTEDGGIALPYHHFSIVMHARRRLAVLTASNIDSSKAMKEPDPTKKYTRDALGGLNENDTEMWIADPRIAASEQLPDVFFNKDRKAFDKGHIVRREENAWGSSYTAVRKANGDTYHTTNCSPQVAGFNRSQQGGLWGKLENFVFKQSKTEKLTLFAGPVLADDDPMFRGVDSDGVVQVKIPARFWKVVVARDGGQLKSFAFLLEQELADVPFEFQVTPTWKAHMVSIPDLEQRVKFLRFPQAVRNSDQADAAGGHELVAATGITRK